MSCHCNSEGFPRLRIKNRRLGQEPTGELSSSFTGQRLSLEMSKARAQPCERPQASPAQAPPPAEREAARRGWAAPSPAGVSPVHVVGGGARPRHHPV